jgi:phosphohistidine phosphatase
VDDSLHQLRIRVRRTRYIMELLRRFAGDAVQDNIEAAKSLQTMMGDIHDYETLIANMHRMKESVEGGRCDLAGLEDELVSHQRKMVARLMKSVKKLNRRLVASPLKAKGAASGGKVTAGSRGVTVVLLRHGTALDRATPGIADDASRPLTRQGKKEARNAGRAIKALGLKTDRVLTSPMLRALETATIAAVQLGLEKKLEITGELAPGGALEAAAARLSAFKEGSVVLLVGHEPFLSSLAAHLLGAGGASIALKKGGALVLRSRGSGEGRTYSLESLLTPSQLKALG